MRKRVSASRAAALRRKVCFHAGWAAIWMEFLLLGLSRAAYLAMGEGLLRVNLAFPLALAALGFGLWLLRLVWKECRQWLKSRHTWTH